MLLLCSFVFSCEFGFLEQLWVTASTSWFVGLDVSLEHHCSGLDALPNFRLSFQYRDPSLFHCFITDYDSLKIWTLQIHGLFPLLSSIFGLDISLVGQNTAVLSLVCISCDTYLSRGNFQSLRGLISSTSLAMIFLASGHSLAASSTSKTLPACAVVRHWLYYHSHSSP